MSFFSCLSCLYKTQSMQVLPKAIILTYWKQKVIKSRTGDKKGFLHFLNLFFNFKTFLKLRAAVFLHKAIQELFIGTTGSYPKVGGLEHAGY